MGSVGSPDTNGSQKRSHCRVGVWRGCGRVCDVESVNALSRFAVGNAPLVIIEWRKKRREDRPSLACGRWSVSWLCCVRESNRLEEQLRAIEMLIIYGR